MTTHYDAIVIGTGQSGPFIAGRLAGAGMKIAVIERKLFGGTCVNTGCIPTKAMVAMRHVAYLVRRAAEYGVHAGEPTVDMKKVKVPRTPFPARAAHGWSSGLQRWTIAPSTGGTLAWNRRER